jgi:hypothetical protein
MEKILNNIQTKPPGVQLLVMHNIINNLEKFQELTTNDELEPIFQQYDAISANLSEHLDHAKFLMKDGFEKQALEVLKRCAIDLDPNPEVYRCLIKIYLHLNQTDHAKHICKTYLEMVSSIKELNPSYLNVPEITSEFESRLKEMAR